MGFDWKFLDEAVDGGFLMRLMSVAVSIGGMLITALLLGIVSGPAPCCMNRYPCESRFRAWNAETLLLSGLDFKAQVIAPDLRFPGFVTSMSCEQTAKR